MRTYHYTYALWKCNRCKAVFERPDNDLVEMHYVRGDRDIYKMEDRDICPECGSIDIEEDYYEEEREEEE